MQGKAMPGRPGHPDRQRAWHPGRAALLALGLVGLGWAAEPMAVWRAETGRAAWRGAAGDGARPDERICLARGEGSMGRAEVAR